MAGQQRKCPYKRVRTLVVTKAEPLIPYLANESIAKASARNNHKFERGLFMEEAKLTNKPYHLINMADVVAKEVDWLWFPYIPLGKLTIVQGDPGEGKTTFVLQLAALLSKGEMLPCDDKEREPVNIIYQTAEDGLEDTIKPRLLEAGADCSKIMVIDESQQELSMTDERLVMAIEETGAKLVILDPIQAYLGADVDMHRANEIRPVLKRLGSIAEKYQCSIILIGHMNKASGSKSTYRGLGSIDFQATARSVLVVGRIKEDPTLRVIAHDKSSLAAEGTSIAFRLDADAGFTWEGRYDISVEDLLSGDSRGQKTKDAKDFLTDVLSDGQKSSKEIEELALEKGIKKKTLNNAKREMNIDSVKIGNQWFWML